MDDLQTQAELAGMVTEAGTLTGGGPPVRQPWVPARLRISGDFLAWSHFDYERPNAWPKKDVDPGGALDRFVRIEDSAEVLAFAQRYGVLILSNLRPSPDPGAGMFAEPLALWLQLATEARAILQVATAMRQAKPAPREAWETLYRSRRLDDGSWPQEVEEGVFEALDAPGPEAAGAAWWHLEPILEAWIRNGRVRPKVPLNWNPAEGPAPIEWAGQGLWGVLAVQLLAAVTGVQGIHYCHACRQPYAPKRTPQRNRRHFCPREECQREGARLRKRDQRVNA